MDDAGFRAKKPTAKEIISTIKFGDYEQLVGDIHELDTGYSLRDIVTITSHVLSRVDDLSEVDYLAEVLIDKICKRNLGVVSGVYSDYKQVIRDLFEREGG